MNKFKFSNELAKVEAQNEADKLKTEYDKQIVKIELEKKLMSPEFKTSLRQMSGLEEGKTNKPYEEYFEEYMDRLKEEKAVDKKKWFSYQMEQNLIKNRKNKIKNKIYKELDDIKKDFQRSIKDDNK